uniref:rRNA adenine N(6)-methyltransferase n=1 Tax=Chenopodium quinoa TaxID=63459 RepID=A0A803KZ31_CHEQI
MLSSLQSFPPNPIPVTSTSKIHHNSWYSTTLTRLPNRRKSLFIVCAANPDDYNATLKALNSRKRFPRKSLGQHYMLNSTINDQLAAVANVKDGDLVLEIGPGTGSLTNVLIDAGATVLAIEKDPHMASLVQERFADTGRLMVIQEDFTKCHIRSHMLSLLESKNLAVTGTRHAKDETAIQLVEPSSRSSEYRPINIFVKFYSDPEYKFQVPRANFFPQPKVDGAVVSFKLKQPSDYPSVPSVKSFFSLINSAFNGKRKMLRNTLQHICTPSEIEETLRTVGLPATSRPEELTLDDFVKLHNSLVNT